MDEAEKHLIAEAWRKRRDLEPFLQEEKRRLQETIPLWEALAQFDGVFRHTLTLPYRDGSGMIAFRKALEKVYR